MMMYIEWVVDGYVGYTQHEVVLDGWKYYTKDAALKAARKRMLLDEGLDPRWKGGKWKKVSSYKYNDKNGKTIYHQEWIKE